MKNTLNLHIYHRAGSDKRFSSWKYYASNPFLFTIAVKIRESQAHLFRSGAKKTLSSEVL